jgi:D-alanyl-D-alanine carboxypeptidase
MDTRRASCFRDGPLALPGESFAYSDTGYVLLGALIETITAQPMPTAVRALLGLDRLGLSHTWFETLEPAPRANLDRARQRLGSLDVRSIHPSADLFGGGGLVSTLADLTRFLRALFEGDILRRETLATMKTPSSQSMVSTGVGYGMGLSARTVESVTCYGHGGFWGVIAWHCPALDLTVAGFVTNTNHRQALATVLEDVVLLFIALPARACARVRTAPLVLRQDRTTGVPCQE